jgi:hypothetical protein
LERKLRNQSFAIWAIQPYKIVYNINFSFGSNHHFTCTNFKFKSQEYAIKYSNILFMIFFKIERMALIPPNPALWKILNFWKRLGARKYFPRNQTLKLEKLEGSKPDDVDITWRKGPSQGTKL